MVCIKQNERNQMYCNINLYQSKHFHLFLCGDWMGGIQFITRLYYNYWIRVPDKINDCLTYSAFFSVQKRMDCTVSLFSQMAQLFRSLMICFTAGLVACYLETYFNLPPGLITFVNLTGPSRASEAMENNSSYGSEGCRIDSWLALCLLQVIYSHLSLPVCTDPQTNTILTFISHSITAWHNDRSQLVLYGTSGLKPVTNSSNLPSGQFISFKLKCASTFHFGQAQLLPEQLSQCIIA